MDQASGKCFILLHSQCSPCYPVWYELVFSPFYRRANSIRVIKELNTIKLQKNVHFTALYCNISHFTAQIK